ncbi:MAG: CDP-archaeol synthase [Candidatus Nanoarchaeia archaeon]
MILEAFWLLAPAGVANMAPVLFKWLPFFDVPVDFGKNLRGHRIFGSHKTWRGLLVGILAGIFVVYLQRLLHPFTQSISLIDYTTINIFILGFLMGFGALFGDLIESFFKRQISIKPGKPWMPWDQVDWVIGSLVFMSFYVHISLALAIASIILYGLLHILINLIGYWLRIKKTKF